MEQNYQNLSISRENSSILDLSKELNESNKFLNKLNIKKPLFENMQPNLDFTLSISNIKNTENLNICKIEESQSLNKKRNQVNEDNNKYEEDNSFNINLINSTRKKLTKADLDNIPLPIFSCIYCSNDYLSFKHLINEILYKKYFFQTSKYDVNIITKIINQPLIIKNDESIYENKLLKLIINSYEYCGYYYSKKDIDSFFHSQTYYNIFFKNNFTIKNKIYEKIRHFIESKKNLIYFNWINDNLRKNNKFNLLKNFSYYNQNVCNSAFGSLINNNIVNNNIINNNIIINSNTNINLNKLGQFFSFNFNSLIPINNNHKNFNEKKNLKKNNEDKNILNISMTERKINKNDISFEENYYNIWNPDITLIKDEDNINNDIVTNINDNKLTNHKKTNSTNILLKINNNIKTQNKNIFTNIYNNFNNYKKYNENSVLSLRNNKLNISKLNHNYLNIYKNNNNNSKFQKFAEMFKPPNSTSHSKNSAKNLIRYNNISMNNTEKKFIIKKKIVLNKSTNDSLKMRNNSSCPSPSKLSKSNIRKHNLNIKKEFIVSNKVLINKMLINSDNKRNLQHLLSKSQIKERNNKIFKYKLNPKKPWNNNLFSSGNETSRRSPMNYRKNQSLINNNINFNRLNNSTNVLVNLMKSNKTRNKQLWKNTSEFDEVERNFDKIRQSNNTFQIMKNINNNENITNIKNTIFANQNNKK